MSLGAAFALTCLAAYRIQRLITEDDLTAGIRETVARRAGRIGELVSCHWCVGSWIAFAATIAVDRWIHALAGGWREDALVALAAAAVVGLLGEIDGRLRR